jgi:Fe(3+) dicitrate transport protein
MLALLLFFIAQSDAAKDPNSTAAPQGKPSIDQRFLVVGSAEQAERTPGSAHFIDLSQLQKHLHSDIHRILAQVPGLNIQEEEGFGLRPNIGMRGTGVERSQKITILEDGVLMAPAPYTAPAAYYFPTAGRMEAVEVKKGPASIEQGPQTTGGVINLVSSPIPVGPAAEASLLAGSNETGQLKALVGWSNDRFGVLAETYQFTTAGFKTLPDGGETGTELQDYLVKMSWTPGSAAFQQFEVKFSRTTQQGQETYLGLSDEDFALDPYARYAASQLDEIDTTHHTYQLRHLFKPGTAWDVATTAYYNDFARDWYKLGSVTGLGIAAVLDDPASHAAAMEILRGGDSADNALLMRHNNRSYFGRGLHSVFSSQFQTGMIQHEFRGSLRLHEDEEDRFQRDDRYAMRAGSMILNQEGQPGSQENRVGSAVAVAAFLQDSLTWGRLTFTPGVRFETIEFSRKDYSKSDPSRQNGPTAVRKNEVGIWLPGLGVHAQVLPALQVFAGIHKGFSPPGAGANEQTLAEESWNHEVGLRLAKGEHRLEIIGFFNDYSNLLGAETLSGGGTGQGELFNGGAVEVSGLEFLARSELGSGKSWSFPFSLAYTWTQSQFMSSFKTSFEDWAPEVQRGDHLPYLPEHQGTLSLGLCRGPFSATLSLHASGAMRSSAGQGPMLNEESLPGHEVLDLGASWQLPRSIQLQLQLRNLSDESYAVARRPSGLRPGMPRTLLLGLSTKF